MYYVYNNIIELNANYHSLSSCSRLVTHFKITFSARHCTVVTTTINTRSKCTINNDRHNNGNYLNTETSKVIKG